MAKLITLSGLDGSGKSTQIELLKKYLKSQGKTFFYFHAVEFSVGNKILKRGKKSPLIPLCERGKPGSPPLKKGELEGDFSVTKANWLEIQLRKVALLIDICRFKRLLKKTKVDYIISDRYFFDSVVNFLYLMQRKKSPLISLCERGKPDSLPFKKGESERDLFAEKFIPKPDFSFYVDVKPEIIMQRERKPDQGMEYLMAKERLFEQKIKEWDLIVIDGERGKEEIFAEIKQQALSLL
jgi:hypothetical protein